MTRDELLAAFRRELIALGVHPVSLDVFERQIRADERERILLREYPVTNDRRAG